LVKIKRHGGFVNLYYDFNHIWNLLNERGEVNLKTEKKKTYFTARPSMITLDNSNEQKKAIIILRRPRKGGKAGSLEEKATCLECCWGHYYSGFAEGIGMYCKALDKWAISIKREGL
jgi:hypothetical protein